MRTPAEAAAAYGYRVSSCFDGGNIEVGWGDPTHGGAHAVLLSLKHAGMGAPRHQAGSGAHNWLAGLTPHGPNLSKDADLLRLSPSLLPSFLQLLGAPDRHTLELAIRPDPYCEADQRAHYQ